MKPSTPKTNWPEWPVSLSGTLDLLSLLRGSSHKTKIHDYLTKTTEHVRMEPGAIVLVSGKVSDSADERRVEARAVENKIKTDLVSWVSGLAPQEEDPSALLAHAMINQSARLAELNGRVSQIERALTDMAKGIDLLRVQQPSVWVPVQSFAPEPYEVLRPFTVVVRPDGEEFEASFFDANLYGSGDTEEEAVSDLKVVMIESFDRLSELGDDKLGPAMLKQKRVLTAHIRRIG